MCLELGCMRTQKGSRWQQGEAGAWLATRLRGMCDVAGGVAGDRRVAWRMAWRADSGRFDTRLYFDSGGASHLMIRRSFNIVQPKRHTLPEELLISRVDILTEPTGFCTISALV